LADIKLTYTIPEGKASTYVNDYIYVHKNTETEEVEGEQVPKYTDGQWVKEHVLRYIKSQIVRGKNMKARDLLIANNADDVTTN